MTRRERSQRGGRKKRDGREGEGKGEGKKRKRRRENRGGRTDRRIVVLLQQYRFKF